MTKARLCVFCGGKPVTREHVLPDWLTEVFRNEIGVTQFDSGTTTAAGDTRKWGGDAVGIDHKVKHVCKACNNGWMSSMEGTTKPVLLPLILATNLPIKLSESDQDLLATWAYKTALVIDLNLKGHNPDQYPPIPASAYKRFYRSRVPPKTGVRVWTIPIVTPSTGLWWRRTEHRLNHKAFVSGKKLIPASRMDVYLITFTIHHVVFQVCGPLSGHAVIRCRDTASNLLQLFPRTSDKVLYPNDGKTMLLGEGLDDFANRTSYIPL